MPDIDGNEVQAPKRDYYVYAYFYPGADRPFYVGKGRGGRARSHFSICRKTQATSLFYSMLRFLFARGINPEVQILHDGLTDAEAKDLEIEYIEKWGRIDIQTGFLTNQTRGGDGLVSLSESTRKRAIERAKATFKKQRRLPEYRKQQSQAMTDYCKHPTAREVRSQCMRDVWKDPVTREARIQRIREGWANSQRQPRTKTRPVESFNLDTGCVVKRYRSQTETSADGFNRDAVNNVCRGKRRSHAGLGWRYTSPSIEVSAA